MDARVQPRTADRMVRGRKGPYYLEAVGGASCAITPDAEDRQFREPLLGM